MDALMVHGNRVEAVLWLLFCLAFGAMAARARGERRRLWTMLAAAFLVFGASDVIESRIGAWWRPWWQLIMKSSCIIGFLVGAIRYRAIRTREITQQQLEPTARSVFCGARVYPAVAQLRR